jgi:hypothetical protein
VINKDVKRIESQYRIRLSRHHGGADGGGWYLTVIDKPSSINILQIRLGGTNTILDDTRDISNEEAFSDLLSSTEAHGEGTLFISPVHGMAQETEKRTVEIPKEVLRGNRNEKWSAFMDELEKTFEAEGWMLSKDDRWNPHRRVGQNNYRVYLHRWAPSKGVKVACEQCKKVSFITSTKEWTLSGPTDCHCGGKRRKV